MKSRDEVDVSRQVRFGENGEMEADEQVESDLADWGIVEPEPERETRVEVEAASEFGIDDRSTAERIQSEQETLVVDTDDGQQTLSGEEASPQSKW